jgi:hypothetical protein
MKVSLPQSVCIPHILTHHGPGKHAEGLGGGACAFDPRNVHIIRAKVGADVNPRHVRSVRPPLSPASAQAQAQINAQAQHALSEKMSSICMKRCVTSATDRLSDKQRQCLANCTASFLEGFGLAVSATGQGESSPRRVGLGKDGVCPRSALT